MSVATAPVAPVMRARAINKVFGATHALRGVDFEVTPGRVTALFGENGAGKSTLMKILAGIETPTTGELELDGEPVAFASAREAADRGIAIIHQELSLFGNLSVSDNLFMARERVRGAGLVVDQPAQRETAARILERLEEPIDVRTPVGELRLGQQQIVEIARALVQDARVLIMDEPTSALSTAEVEVLFRTIRELKAAGVAIVYISHHLEEALEIADHVVVVRDGRLVAEDDAANVDLGWIVERMVGRNPDDLFPDEHPKVGEERLRVDGLTVADARTPGRLAVDDVSFEVRAGEVVGLYGLMGAGRTELLEALAGRLPLESGEVAIDGARVDGDIGERIARGIALVPEDRQRDGLVQPMSVGQNMSLAGLRRFIRGAWVSRDSERAAVSDAMRDVTVKAPGPDVPITSLSGGNQQKVVLGRALLTEPRVLLLDEPTRGIDVGAKADIFTLVTTLAERGLAVLFATSEIEEALHVPDRLLVMAKGTIVCELRRGSATREEIMLASEGLERTGAGA
jgi:erythritol transport system ATP-binding protein